MTKRKQHKPEFKARGALEAMTGEQTVGEPVRRPPDDDPSMEEGAGRRGGGGLSAWPPHCRAGGCRSYQGAACHSAGVTPRESAS